MTEMSISAEWSPVNRNSINMSDYAVTDSLRNKLESIANIQI